MHAALSYPCQHQTATCCIFKSIAKILKSPPESSSAQPGGDITRLKMSSPALPRYHFFGCFSEMFQFQFNKVHLDLIKLIRPVFKNCLWPARNSESNSKCARHIIEPFNIKGSSRVIIIYAISLTIKPFRFGEMNR